jgi:transposase
MPRALRIRLTEEEKQQLDFLSNQVKTTKRTKTRIEVLKLSDRGWKVEQIALELNCVPATVRRTIARWFSQEKEGLFDAPRSGRTRKWQEEDLEFLEKCLEQEQRTYKDKAQEHLQKTGEITVIIQDNYSVHKSQKVKPKEPEWREKGLEFFFLSSYSPELNQIEPEWHQLKTHELAGRMFEDEYDLAQAVIEGIEERSQKKQLYMSTISL